MRTQTETQTEEPARAVDRRRRVRQAPFTDLHVRSQRTGKHVEVRPPDLSTHGMFIATAQKFPAGDTVTISFCLAHSLRAVRLKGVVRYCLDGVGIGVEFTDIDPETRAELERATRGRGNDW